MNMTNVKKPSSPLTN